jgi:heat-inducible transcriptional repressor
VTDTKKRQGDVLTAIVESYVETAEPVGSRCVARRLGLSSATIRNVMADLEDMGLITHPHTSAGRIPTDKGYRYYIDSLMHVKLVSAQLARSVQEEYAEAMRSLEDLMETTSHLMAGLTNCVGLTLMSEYDKLYLDGTSHIVEQPEFHDFKKLYSILKCLDEKRELLEVLRHDYKDGKLSIHIGRESGFQDLNDCSIVTRGYKKKGRVSGRVGVIGPKRMVYEKVIPTVEFLADTLTEILDTFEG